MKKMKLNKGKVALVDDEDFEYLNRWKWHINDNGYAVRTKYTKLGFKKYEMKRIYMHREVNNTLDGFQTDHINQNRLDNRRINLRMANNQQNAFNASLSKANTSGTKGVSWSNERKKWCAYIHFNNKAIPLGRFLDIKDAIFARKQAEKKYHIFEHIPLPFSLLKNR